MTTQAEDFKADLEALDTDIEIWESVSAVMQSQAQLLPDLADGARYMSLLAITAKPAYASMHEFAMEILNGGVEETGLLAEKLRSVQAAFANMDWEAAQDISNQWEPVIDD